MLGLPQRGFQRSVDEHNVELPIMCDWIEASVVFTQAEVSQADVVDVLTENNIYESQDFAAERVGDAWSELRRRAAALGEVVPFEVLERSVKPQAPWRACPGYSFCVMLSLLVWYPAWAKQFGPNYTTQGILFERLVEEGLVSSGWSTLRTGWSPGKPAKIRQVVANVAQHLAESEIPGAIDTWIPAQANEEGLDVVCARPFRDGWGGRPLFFIQCASGANWPNKVGSIDPLTWFRVINLTTIPQCGLATPFAPDADEFRQTSGKVKGMFLDRHRLAAPDSIDARGWESKALTKDIAAWLKPRVSVLEETAS